MRLRTTAGTDPFAELSDQAVSDLAGFANKLAWWMGLSRPINMIEAVAIWKKNPELRDWLIRHVNRAVTLYRGANVAPDRLPAVGDRLVERAVRNWSTDEDQARRFAGIGMRGAKYAAGYIMQAKPSSKNIVIDLDAFSRLAGRYRPQFIAAMQRSGRVHKDAVDMFSGDEYEGEVVTAGRVPGTVIRAERWDVTHSSRVRGRAMRTNGETQPPPMPFKVGDLVRYSKYKNRIGKILRFGTNHKGQATVVIEPVPKGRKQDKELGLFKIWTKEKVEAARPPNLHSLVFDAKYGKIDDPKVVRERASHWARFRDRNINAYDRFKAKHGDEAVMCSICWRGILRSRAHIVRVDEDLNVNAPGAQPEYIGPTCWKLLGPAVRPYEVKAEATGMKREIVTALVRAGHRDLARKFVQAGKLKNPARQKVNRDLIKAKLDGNGRFRGIAAINNKIADVLETHGLQIGDVMDANLFRGREGRRTFAVEFVTDDPFSPELVENSLLALQWYQHDTGLYEAVVYLS